MYYEQDVFAAVRTYYLDTGEFEMTEDLFEWITCQSDIYVEEVGEEVDLDNKEEVGEEVDLDNKEEVNDFGHYLCQRLYKEGLLLVDKNGKALTYE